MTDMNKTPDCDMREALVSYLYNEATPQEVSRVEDHITGCEVCKQELAAFERVRDQLQQWQLNDMPIVRVVTEPQGARRSALAALKELLTVMPAWGKAIGAVAAVLLVLAVIGTNVSVGRDGFSLRFDLARRQQPREPVASTGTQDVHFVSEGQLDQFKEGVEALVSRMITESERRHKEDLKAQLVSFESQLQNMRSADLAKIAMRIQEHHIKIRTLERDIDRREGSDLTDILFSELNTRPERPRGAARNGGE
ncbi:MAG TPA: zf-HC2 domain-containing protein [Blastocatellia bacterium]|nr:zf-HC2 domain-containing protein [Blastocatellia bacterium]